MSDDIMRDTTCWCEPPYERMCEACQWLEHTCDECEQPRRQCTCTDKLEMEAADEIKRLRTENQTLKEEKAYWRLMGREIGGY